MRKNSDYFANNQLLLAENVGFEKYFCEKCDFCPFLGDLGHFASLFRQGDGRVTADRQCASGSEQRVAFAETP